MFKFFPRTTQADLLHTERLWQCRIQKKPLIGMVNKIGLFMVNLIFLTIKIVGFEFHHGMGFIQLGQTV